MSVASSLATRWPQIEASGFAARRDIINDVEHVKASAAGKLITHEILKPPRIGFRLDEIGARMPTTRRQLCAYGPEITRDKDGRCD